MKPELRSCITRSIYVGLVCVGHDLEPLLIGQPHVPTNIPQDGQSIATFQTVPIGS